ncbi:MAG: DUF4426 domain-containing protein [Pseudomonadales bacterium]|nr:DUF4426 domain-containing protein [Pseudomonadales bacterium]
MASVLPDGIARAKAAQFISCQGFDIHYTTFSSMLIPAQVAAAHNIVRSEQRIVTNISVRKANQPVRAIVSGTATNLLNQMETMQFEEVLEQTAVYYLASQLVDERDRVSYDLLVTPVGATSACQLSFIRDYIH